LVLLLRKGLAAVFDYYQPIPSEVGVGDATDLNDELSLTEV
jgi:hypothetical protein